MFYPKLFPFTKLSYYLIKIKTVTNKNVKWNQKIASQRKNFWFVIIWMPSLSVSINKTCTVYPHKMKRFSHRKSSFKFPVLLAPFHYLFPFEKCTKPFHLTAMNNTNKSSLVGIVVAFHKFNTTLFCTQRTQSAFIRKRFWSD